MRPLTAALMVLLLAAAAAVAIAVWGSSDGADPSPSPPTAEGSTAPTSAPTATAEPEYDFPSAETVGACFDPITHRADGSLMAIRLWDCDEPHLAELLAVEEISAADDDSWPGQAEVDAEAERVCDDAFRDYVGINYERSSIPMTIYPPSRETWDSGDREIWCIAETTSAAPFTSSVRNLRD